jgi:hypothetical protein
VYFVPLFLAISHILKKNKKKNTKKDKKKIKKPPFLIKTVVFRAKKAFFGASGSQARGLPPFRP